MVINMTAVLICAIICFTIVALFHIAATTATRVEKKEDKENDEEDDREQD